MVKLSVIYQGRPHDAAVFDEYYWSAHLPTVARWPGIRRITLAMGEPGEDIYQICKRSRISRADNLRIPSSSSVVGGPPRMRHTPRPACSLRPWAARFSARAGATGVRRG
jgi:hypothetical protein